MSSPVLEVRALTKHFPVRRTLLGGPARLVKAVDGIDLAIGAGETLGLIGESGCGKTTTSKLILRQETPTSGTIRFEGRDIASLQGADLMAYRRAVQVVFQDPFSSLSPRMRVGDIIAEPLEIHTDLPRAAIEERVGRVLELVGLAPDVAPLFPHEFSGGQRQRIAIARAPSKPIAGEVPSALSLPSGCRFHPRCPSAMPVCSQTEPALRRREGGGEVACHLYP